MKLGISCATARTRLLYLAQDHPECFEYPYALIDGDSEYWQFVIECDDLLSHIDAMRRLS